LSKAFVTLKISSNGNDILDVHQIQKLWNILAKESRSTTKTTRKKENHTLFISIYGNIDVQILDFQ